jgi:two-component system, NarL family, nitrate/nitrite response regulator NarL
MCLLSSKPWGKSNKQGFTMTSNQDSSISVLIVDDHALVRETIALSLSLDGDWTFNVSPDINSALQAIRENGRYNTVLLDYEVPGTQGLEGLEKLIEANEGGVALFSGVASNLIARRALEAGASGFIPKTLPLKSLKNAIRFIAEGEVYVPADFTLRESKTQGDHGLKPRELQVLSYLAEGLPNKEIGRRLGSTETIVKLDVKSICRKLDVKNRTQIVIEAGRRGLI